MSRATRVTLRSTGPFDLDLSLAAASSFLPPNALPPAIAILRIGAKPALASFRQVSRRPAIIEATADRVLDRAALRDASAWLLSADLDLRPFYRLAGAHPILGALTKSLRGLKPLRPASLFEMAVIAITEQQISLAAAYHIRQRLVERFGERRGKFWAFPSVECLAAASSRSLFACGLSHRKVEYTRGLARDILRGKFDLEALRGMSDAPARAYIARQRGFGPWSADYILVRGLGRIDCIPFDDLGVRDAVGQYLGRGARASPETVARLTRPFAPYRGLAIFYLLVAHRRELRRAQVRR